MAEDDVRLARVVIQDIPMGVRQIVAEWLRAQAVHGGAVAYRLATANKHLQDPGAATTVQYWRHYEAACKQLAIIMASSQEIPDRAPGAEKDVNR